MRFARAFVCATTLIALAFQAAAMPIQAQETPRDAADPKRPVTIDDFFRLRTVGTPRISPEGGWIAYTVRKAKVGKKEDKWESSIWAVPSAGGTAIRMTAPGSSASNPRWDPTGRTLAFLSARNKKKAQVWLLNRNGGDASVLTEVRQGIQGFEWAPDGKRLILVIQDPAPEILAAQQAEKDGKKYSEPAHRRPHVIDRLQFKQDYVGYLDRRRTHLFVFDFATKEMTQITAGDYDDSNPAWSPDGGKIAFVSNRSGVPDSNYNTDVWVVDAAKPASENPPLRITANQGPDASPAWSPDGKWIATISATDVTAMVYATNHLALAASDGSSFQALTESVDRNMSSPRFSADGQFIHFIIEDSGEQSLARIPIGGSGGSGGPSGKVERTIAGPRVVSGFELGPNGMMAVRISEPTLPGEIFIRGANGKLRRVSHTNDAVLAGLQLVEAENVQFPSADGAEIEGFIYKPVGFQRGKRYPTILRIHGGPQSQFNFAFAFESQLYAANGYVVVMTNPRGSTGYGQDFSLAIWQDWGGKDFHDVNAGIDFAIAQGYSDPSRLGVGGWSYGGILTNYVIARTTRFAAAISGASEVLIVANYGHDIYQRWWEQELGLPWETRAAYEQLSVFNDVEKIVTPTLILGGEEDWNVPIQNSEQLYLALKRLGRETQLIVYPGEFHGIRVPSYQRDRFERYLDWYGRYLTPEK